MKSFRLKQQTPSELTDSLLDFLRRKFYENDNVNFAKDRKRLLAWVVLWPAWWLKQKGVTLPSDKYREMFFQVFLEAKANAASKITYRPAWMRHVIQEHFKHHGDEIYERAKSIRSVVEHIILSTGKRPTNADPDPTDTLAAARALIDTGKAKKQPKKTASKAPVNDQLTML